MPLRGDPVARSRGEESAVERPDFTGRQDDKMTPWELRCHWIVWINANSGASCVPGCRSRRVPRRTRRRSGTSIVIS